MERGLYPYTARWLPSLDNHFSTIGVNGCNEMVRNFTRDAYDITDPQGHALTARLLDHLNALLVEAQEETGHLYNLEATPAEGATYRFARADRQRHPGILQAGTDAEPYYTNPPSCPSRTPPTFAASPPRRTCRPGTPAAPSSTSHGRPSNPATRAPPSCAAPCPPSVSPTSPSPPPSPSAPPTATFRRPPRLPHLRHRHRGVDPRHGLLPPCQQLQHRQEGGVPRTCPLPCLTWPASSPSRPPTGPPPRRHRLHPGLPWRAATATTPPSARWGRPVPFEDLLALLTAAAGFSTPPSSPAANPPCTPASVPPSPRSTSSASRWGLTRAATPHPTGRVAGHPHHPP